jgi:hypothetical protein
MRGCGFAVAAMIAIMFVWHGPAAAGGVVRWVDKDGKVHYSETPPSEAPAAESRIEVHNAGSTADEPAAPSAQGKSRDCATIKCLGDQMEADRLQREREYERQREKAAKAEKADKRHDRYDDVMRQNCLNMGASTKTNCNDKKEVRKLYGK